MDLMGKPMATDDKFLCVAIGFPIRSHCELEKVGRFSFFTCIVLKF